MAEAWEEKANDNKYFSSMNFTILFSHCSFLKSIDHNVLNAVTWHQ